MVESPANGAGAGGGELHGRHFSADELTDIAGLGADWLWETDAEHRFTWFSESYREVTGLSPDDHIGRSRTEFIKSIAVEDQNAEAHLAALTAHEPFRDFIYEVSAGSETYRWVATSGYPRFDEDGAFIGYRGTARNVTKTFALVDELKDVRRELSVNESYRRVVKTEADGSPHVETVMAALDAMQDAFCCYDRDDRLVLYNRAFVEMYPGLEDILRPGVPYEMLLDRGLDRGVFDLGGTPREEWRRIALEQRSKQESSESVITLADGRVILHRDMHTEGGGSICLRTDITELKAKETGLRKAKREAEAARQRLQSAIDALDDGFVLWDAEDRLVACNMAFRRQFSFLPNLGEGRTFSEMFLEFAHSGVVKDAIGREEEWVAEHAGKRAEEVDQEIVFQTHDGRWMMRRDQLTENGDRVGIRTDITDYKQREDALARAQEHSQEVLSDLNRTIEAMRMGVVLLTPDLETEIINQAFYDIWKVTQQQVPLGSPFRALMEVNRHNGIYDVADEDWEGYVADRLAEIRAGDVEPREFDRADGATLIYSVRALSGGKRLVTYYDITPLKEREAQLAHTLEQARLAEAVINSVPNPIFVKDENLEYVTVNEAFAEPFDLEPKDMVGRKAADFVDADEAAGFELSERAVLETGEVHETEEDSKVSGVERFRIIRKNLVRTPGGRNYVAGTIFDVTEVKRREREAEDARRQLANVLESLPAGVIIYDQNDRFVLANRKIQDALPEMVDAMQPGRPLRDALEAAHDAGYFRESGDPDLDAIYDTNREGWIDRYIERYHVTHRVTERKNPHGRWSQAYDTRTPDGIFVGVRVDITELKEREAALRESMRENELYRSLTDNVPVAIYAKHPDFTLAYVNKGWCDLTGLSREDAIGRTDADIFGESGTAFMDGDRAVLSTGETQEIEETVTDRDGNPHHQIARKSTMVASDGSLYLIGSTTDVTELKQREHDLRLAQEKAVLADRAKSEFLANMSHEIRTPMNGILGMAELLAKSELDSKQKTFTDIIVKSGNALLTIINDILDFSKIDAGQLVLDPAPFELAEAVEDVATLMSTRAKEKDLELIARVEPGLERNFVGDVGRFRQIVTNLMGNAVKFTDSGHVLIDVTGQPAGSETRLRVEVTDTGIGIPQDKLAAVFEKFSQVDGSSTRRHEGTGLGLAITARLVELMGGEIGVESEEGKGSTFWFEVTLPMARDQKRTPVTPIDVSGARIVIIDDNDVNRSILSEQMAAWGFDSCAASGGQEGIEVLRAAAEHGLDVDCLVLDYQMPGMTGVDVARAIRSIPEINRTPIVMLTSVDQSLGGGLYREIGIAAQLVKPARSSHLLETLVSTIQKYRHGSEAEPEDAAVEQARGDDAPVIAQPRPEASFPSTPADGATRRVDILVAEDNEVNQLVFSQVLSETGFTYEIVSNGALAVEAFGKMNPRMILMDVSMPQMNGLEATGAIRQAETGLEGSVPIIGVTAHALKGDREKCLEAGMDDYLSKPISPKALMEKIERWLGSGQGEGRRTG